MIILGIETSCDETAASVVKDGREILSSVVASSQEMHVKSGGIIPEQAAREQVKSIIPVIEEALTASHLSHLTSKLDAIAVTVGPGLIGSLLVGVETAKTISWVWNKPIIPVNHLVAHIYANWLSPQEPSSLIAQQPSFPAITLVVSGGHTDLVLMKGHGKIEWIGGTRDDAAGEAFDKTARLLGLGYPGGPAIAAEAAKFQIPDSRFQIQLPRPLMGDKTFDFSFSGLKTAVLREAEKLKKGKQWNNETMKQLSHEVQETITDVLVAKTLRAAKEYKVPTVLLAGGVAANQRLREKFTACILDLDFDLDFRAPPPHLCTDNASFISSFAEYNFHPVPWQKITANPGLTIIGEV